MLAPVGAYPWVGRAIARAGIWRVVDHLRYGWVVAGVVFVVLWALLGAVRRVVRRSRP